MFARQSRTELGIGNLLLLAEEKLTTNTRLVQARNDIEPTDGSTVLEAWELFDGPANIGRRCPHLSVEMETGTGKTYVCLRTIFELSRHYGFQAEDNISGRIRNRRIGAAGGEWHKDHGED